MSEIRIPPAFARAVEAERGEAGQRWLQALPAKIEKYCALWNLVIDGLPWHGYLGLVLPVVRGSEHCVLKVTWVDDETRHEALALRLWDGRGAVNLFEAEPEDGALLLERLDATCNLDSVDIDRAVTIAGGLMRRLAIPAPPGLPTVRDYALRQASAMQDLWQKFGCPFPEHYIQCAQAAATELGPSAQNTLVNQDLHYENVLAGEREPWLVIDPKIIAGDIEFAVAPLLWNRLHTNEDRLGLSRRLALLVDAANLDRHRSRCWTLVRCVDYSLWALSIGMTEDPKRMAVIIEWLL